MELIFLEYFFPRLIPHKGKIALSGRYYWKLLNALGQYGLTFIVNHCIHGECISDPKFLKPYPGD